MKNQVLYVNNRFINEGDRLSDVLEIANYLNIEGFLLTVGIKKAFDSINHSYLLCAGFGNDFIK